MVGPDTRVSRVWLQILLNIQMFAIRGWEHQIPLVIFHDQIDGTIVATVISHYFLIDGGMIFFNFVGYPC
jgi:hypothetical protein